MIAERQSSAGGIAAVEKLEPTGVGVAISCRSEHQRQPMERHSERDRNSPEKTKMTPRHCMKPWTGQEAWRIYKKKVCGQSNVQGKTNRTRRTSPVEMSPSRISLRHENFRMGHLLRRTAQFEEVANLKSTGTQNTMLRAAHRCKLPEET